MLHHLLLFSNRFKSPVGVIWKPCRFSYHKLIQHQKWIQVHQLHIPDIPHAYFMMWAGLIQVHTSGLPTLLLTLAPSPSSCSTESTFFTTCLAAVLIFAAIPKRQGAGWSVFSKQTTTVAEISSTAKLGDIGLHYKEPRSLS